MTRRAMVEVGVTLSEAEAEAYCRQPAGTLTPGIGPRWDPWPYICSVSIPLFFSLSLILLIDKGGVGLLNIYRLVFTYYNLLHLRLHSSFLSQGFSRIYINLINY
jgi:hypothetical protein